MMSHRQIMVRSSERFRGLLCHMETPPWEVWRLAAFVGWPGAYLWIGNRLWVTGRCGVRF